MSSQNIKRQEKPKNINIKRENEKKNKVDLGSGRKCLFGYEEKTITSINAKYDK